MCMCPQNSKILRLISLLNPAMSAEEAIITATLKDTATTAIRIISLEKFFPPENAIRRAMKKGRFTNCDLRYGMYDQEGCKCSSPKGIPTNLIIQKPQTHSLVSLPTPKQCIPST